jgi:hypothetical protein
MLLIFKNNAYFEHFEQGDILWKMPSLSMNRCFKAATICSTRIAIMIFVKKTWVSLNSSLRTASGSAILGSGVPKNLMGYLE